MPVSSFDPQDAPADRSNVWGYNPVSFFAPHAGYASCDNPSDVLDEFRDMVRALHRAGLKVIMDVVYNHTAEAGPEGPTISWRGFDEFAYYIGDEGSSLYQDHTGCGNTFNANHFLAGQMILDSLRHWVKQFHIDGFRFDLAAAMTRDTHGQPLAEPPTLWAINDDPDLQSTRLIAEAWDTSGLHLVHDFPGDRFACWNGPFRDTARKFLKGDENTIEDLMARIVGSRDIFAREHDLPSAGVNFVTCHDGFTLRDLVTYEQKNNWENGEENRDGTDHNINWNSGHEGPSDDEELKQLRERRLRNHLVLLFFSLGTPMMLAGDEWGQSRDGNNNPWCLDNERNWLDWDLAGNNAGLLRFVRTLARFTNNVPALAADHFWSVTHPGHEGDITWHGTEPHLPDWSPHSRHLAFELTPPQDKPYASRFGSARLLVFLNTENSELEFNPAPAPLGESWHKMIDTSQATPDDIQTDLTVPLSARKRVAVPSHSVVVLVSKA
ncbi:MAG: isoamylase [Candidatus Krumholzibacteriia bacterium]|jgi:isoamylase